MEGRSFSGRELARLCALGAFSGFINGIFGSGGGVPIVLTLWALAKSGLGDRRRVFANVTAMILPMSLASSLVYFRASPPASSDGIAIAAASLVGGAVGAYLLGKLKIEAIKTIFAILMVVSGVIMILR